MKKKKCPCCQIASLFVKNGEGERHSIYVDEQSVIHSKNGAALDGLRAMGYDLETIFCFGCSWSGKISELKRF